MRLKMLLSNGFLYPIDYSKLLQKCCSHDAVLFFQVALAKMWNNITNWFCFMLP